jgi:DUF4097 and DUF4098 domain-containing protein YvlB
MKRVLLTVAIGLCCISQSLFAGDKVDQTLKAEKDGYVEIEHINGYAHITAWDKSEVRVVGELGDRTKAFIFERDGNEILIKVKVNNSSDWNNWGVDDGDALEIFVPRDSQVNYSSVNANVQGSGIEGGAHFDTVNGGIEVKDLAGRIRLESVNGNISASKLKGDLKIETVNGEIRSTNNHGKEDRYESVNGDIVITSASREINAETVNGDIDLTLSEIGQLNLDTVNGSIEARLTLLPDGEVSASSIGGSVSLYFQEEISARFDIRSHSGGKIVNKISDDPVQKGQYGPIRSLEFSLNGGNGKVEVSTISGRVRLDKQ